MTFEEWGKQDETCKAAHRAMYADWKAEREQLIDAAEEVIGECGLNGSIEKLEAVLEQVKG